MTQTIYVVGTEPFFEKYSGDASSYLADVASFCSNSWDQYIYYGTSGYEADFTAWGEYESDLPVPKNELAACSLDTDGSTTCVELSDRRKDARDYLKANWDRYGTADAILVIDYYGGDAKDDGDTRWTYGHAGGGAGTWDKVCIADVYYQEQGYSSWTTGKYSEVGLAGTAWHEILHMYGGYHNDSSIYSDGDTSILYSWGADKAGCLRNGSEDTRKDIVTECTKTAVRNYIN